ncbi:MAG: hypothetical protein ACSLE1_18400 [Sphingobium sp.]
MTEKPEVPQDPVAPTPPPGPEPIAPSDAVKGSKKSVAIGAAAVGIGSAAIVAALLYTRRR